MLGIGYRKDFSDEFMQQNHLNPDFIEVAPENWMQIGGYWKKVFNEVTEKYPLFTHGLSLSVGSPDELDYNFLGQLKKFIKEYKPLIYSEHLSFSKCDNAHLYDLLPIPFTSDAVKHVAHRIQQVQDFLGQRICIENVSYYTPVAAEMSELEFINAIVKEADCDLLLDVNNVYVNAFNHQYNAQEFILQMPLERVKYIHMAGHTKVSDDLIIDTHGEAIINPVYQLFDFTMRKLQRDVPILLERDFNIPELAELQKELNRIKEIKTKALKESCHVIS
jgi:uncharacterized protein (UPF0276 family)